MSVNSNSISNNLQLFLHPEFIQKNNNDYSFTKEFINTINNFDFKKSAYETLCGITETEQSYIWNVLSNITENQTSSQIMFNDISEEFENNILNYIDNISNVDLCKIKALQSMIYQLGINYTIFDKIKLMPLQIKKLLDLLSVKKEFLVNSDTFKKIFTELLFTEISSDENIDENIKLSVDSLTNERLSSQISSTCDEYPLSTQLDEDKISVDYNVYLNDKKLHDYEISIFYNVISNFCYMTYNNRNIHIFQDLSTNILLSDFTLPANTLEIDNMTIQQYKLKYNISKKFNEITEYDKIENGITQYDDYSIHEQVLLSNEAKFRSLPQDANKLYSRNYYYRQKLVREYFQFVENEYANYLSLYLSTQQYNIDNSYLLVTNNNKNQLLSVNEENHNDGNLDDEMILYVANTLANITDSIREIREQVKTQVQKNFIKGTKTHLEFIIKDYIKNNAYPLYKKLANNLGFDVSNIIDYNVSDIILYINEYTDPTEYFNISTDNDKLSDNVNLRFWQEKSTINQVIPKNNTNIFEKIKTTYSATQHYFNTSDINNFYKQNLQIHFNTDLSYPLSNNDYLSVFDEDQNKHLSMFLSSVYDSGADNCYLDCSSNICCNLDFNVKTNSEKQRKISELPTVEFQTISSNIEKISNLLNQDFNITYTLSGTMLSDVTVEMYSNILTYTQSILSTNNQVLSDIDVVLTETETEEDKSEWREYKEKLFKKYSGTDIGSESFYNIKNKKHPSYQIHPYVNNFIEKSNFEYPIDNIANLMSEKISEIILDKLSNYVDKDGYIINDWDLQLNSNSDYITEYEKSSNKTPLNQVSKQIDYDGLFYPAALDDFLNNKEEFINKLSGFYIGIDNTSCENQWYKDLNLSHYERKAIADQLENLYFYIKEICKESYTDIYRYGKDYYGNSYALIKQYDNCNNFDDIAKLEPDQKKNVDGIMWMRIKNHPIAFPMIYTEIKNPNNEKFSQIKYDTLSNNNSFNSNTYFDNMSCYEITSINLSVPLFKDFTISKDKTEIMFYGNNLSDEKQIMCTSVKKVYYKNKPDMMYKHYLAYAGYNDNIKSTYNESNLTITKNFDFVNFYNFNSYLGWIETSCSTVDTNHTMSCGIKLPYFEKDSITSEFFNKQLQLFTILSDCANDANTDYRIDVTNNKRLTIAYRRNVIENDLSLIDYNGKQIYYPGYKDNKDNTQTSFLSTNNRLDIFKNGIITLDYRFNTRTIDSIDFTREFLSYNDLGFIPIYEKVNEDDQYNKLELSNYINKLSEKPNNNCWIDNVLLYKGQLKFNLVGRSKTVSAENCDYGIFFKHVRPIRMHEQYHLNLSNINDMLPLSVGYQFYQDQISGANYYDVRYSEILSSIYNKNSDEIKIYNPHEFEKYINKYNLDARLDESYVNTFLKDEQLCEKYEDKDMIEKYGRLIKKETLDMYNDNPWILHCNDENRISDYIELYNPGKDGQTISVENQDNYIIMLKLYKLSSDNTTKEYYDQISVSWIAKNENRYGLSSGIKLDFNTALYNKNEETHGGKTFQKNYFNWKHQFLNLDNPGDSGYLRIWHTVDNGEKISVPGNIYFIKNISDDKPKFILSQVMNEKSIDDILYIGTNLIVEDDTHRKSDGYPVQNYNIIVNKNNQQLVIDNAKLNVKE